MVGIFNLFLLNRYRCSLINILLECARGGLDDKQSALVQITAHIVPVSSHYMKHWWSNLVTHLCSTR